VPASASPAHRRGTQLGIVMGISLECGNGAGLLGRPVKARCTVLGATRRFQRCQRYAAMRQAPQVAALTATLRKWSQGKPPRDTETRESGRWKVSCVSSHQLNEETRPSPRLASSVP